MDVEKILAQLVRIGTVTSADPVKRAVSYTHLTLPTILLV